MKEPETNINYVLFTPEQYLDSQQRVLTNLERHFEDLLGNQIAIQRRLIMIGETIENVKADINLAQRS